MIEVILKRKEQEQQEIKLKEIFYRSLSVLNGELYSDLEALPVSGGLGDVLTDLLGRETKGTDLAGREIYIQNIGQACSPWERGKMWLQPLLLPHGT